VRCFKWLLLLTVLSLLAGCSVVSQFKQATLVAGSGSWKAQPLALRQKYPEWIQSVYYTAELQTSDISKWQLYLLSQTELGAGVINARAELIYLANGQQQSESFDLQLQQIEEPTATQKYFRYRYQFGADAIAFYQSYQPKRFAGQAKPLQLYYLQPLYAENQVDLTQVLRVEYALLPEYGTKTVGELMRLMFNLRQRDWEEFCQSPRYLYDKTSACGKVQITEASSTKPAPSSPD
jgi:hypothetical protein